MIRYVAFAVLMVPAAILAQQPRIEGPLSLFEAVVKGLRHSPMLAAVRSEVEAARAETAATRGEAGPQLAAHSFFSRGSIPAMGQSSMGVQPMNMQMLIEGTNLIQNLTLMLPIYTGGLLAAMVAEAAAMEGAASAELLGAESETRLRVREAYYRVLLAAEIARAEDARVVAATELVRTTRDLVEVGRAIEATLLRAEAELADARRAAISAQNEHAKALLDLLGEMGVALDSEVTLSDALALQPVPEGPTPFIAAAEARRGELIAARRMLRAAEARLSAAKGAAGPQLYGFAMGDAFSNDGDKFRTGYSAGLTLSLPIFDGGRRRAEVARAQAVADRARGELAQIALTVEKEVRQAWLDVETAAEIYRTAEAVLAAAEEAYEVIALRVEAGRSIMLEQLDALEALTRARANLAQALYDHSVALARLSRAAGDPDLSPGGES